MKKQAKIVVSKNGPYLVSGSLPLGHEVSVVGGEGEPEQWVKGKSYPCQKAYALCRCGQSKHKPFCDSTHARVGFDGTEVASRKPYAEQAETTRGPGVDLTDAEALCSSAGFCLPKGGTWDLTSGSADPEKRKIAIEQACNCPSGRLVAYDKQTGKPIDMACCPQV